MSTDPNCEACAGTGFQADGETACPCNKPADNLRDTILELAAKDREATLHNVFAALEELQAIRPAVAGIAYDPMLIGAHAEAKVKLGAALMGMLTDGNVIEFAQQRTISGAAAMQATLMVVLPVGVTVEPADQEVTKN